MVAALYVILTYISNIVGLANGAIQFRISEALCILPVFFPEAVFGLAVGCAISNLITACPLWDIVLGSAATLIGAFGARALKFLPEKLKWLLGLPTVISNAVIIPFVLMYVYEFPGSYFYFLLTVGLGELVCALIGGALLYYSIKKRFKSL